MTWRGNRPYDGGISPANRLNERFRVPARLPSSVSDSGSEPLSRLEDKSRWFSDFKWRIWSGIGPESELLERSMYRRLVGSKRRTGTGLEKLL